MKEKKVKQSTIKKKQESKVDQLLFIRDHSINILHIL